METILEKYPITILDSKEENNIFIKKTSDEIEVAEKSLERTLSKINSLKVKINKNLTERSILKKNNRRAIGAEKDFIKEAISKNKDVKKSLGIELKNLKDDESEKRSIIKTLNEKNKSIVIKDYPVIDLSFLSLVRPFKTDIYSSKPKTVKRNVFAVVSCNSNDCTLLVEVSSEDRSRIWVEWNNYRSLDQNRELRKCASHKWSFESPLLNKMMGKESAKSYIENNLIAELKASFSGIIPEDARNKIKKAKKIFGKDNVYIVFEAEKWEEKIASISWRLDPNPSSEKIKEIDDPLIIAVDEFREVAYFCGDFFCTPLEKLVKKTYVGNHVKN